MSKVTLLLILCLLSLGVGKGLHTLKDGFSYRRIQNIAMWASEDFDEETKQALSQKYIYLGRGRQCFAFESEDHRYVIKFPRTDLYKTSIWEQCFLPKKQLEKRKNKRNKKKHFVLNSFEIAYKELKEETAMVALHLGEGELKQTITLIDNLGFTHRIPIGNASFALQYKKPVFIDEFMKSRQENDQAKAKKLIEELVLSIKIRAEKGILNKDRSFLKNFGYDGKTIYQIDVGSFYYNFELSKNEAIRKSMMDSIDPVQEWIKTVDPEMLNYLNSLLPNY